MLGDEFRHRSRTSSTLAKKGNRLGFLKEAIEIKTESKKTKSAKKKPGEKETKKQKTKKKHSTEQNGAGQKGKNS